MVPDHRLPRERVHRGLDPVDVTAWVDGPLSAVSRPGCRSGARDGMSPTRRLRRSARPALRVLHAAVLPAAGRWVRTGEQQRRRARPAAGQRPRPCFLLLDAWSQGGTVRTVLHTAQQLAVDHDVEVVSLLRDAEHPHFPFPPGIGVRVLDDRTRPRARPARWLSRLPSVLWRDVEQAYPHVSLWLDLQLLRHLRTLDADVVVGTRHAMTVLLGALVPDDVVTVAQVHLAAVQQHPDLRRALRRSSRRVDAVVVLSDGEQRDHRPVLAGSRARLVRIPNAVPPLGGGPADPAAKVVVAVGRLRQQKGFDLPVLVPPEDVTALTAALLTMVEDDELRARCGRAARRTAEQYGTAQVVARRWALYDELLRARDATGRAPRSGPALPAGRPVPAAPSQR